MPRLHRRQNAQTRHASDVLATQVLGMFNAKTSIPRPVFRLNFFKNIQQELIGLVANSVQRRRQTGAIRRGKAFFHNAFRQHLLRQQTAGFRCIVIRLAHIRRTGPQRAIHKSFETAQAQPGIVCETVLAQLQLFFPLMNLGTRINAHR